MNDNSLFLRIDPELKQPQPYMASIEHFASIDFSMNRSLHPFHLGTHILIAKSFCEELYRRHLPTDKGCMSVGLMRAGKLIDVYDGRDWSSDLNERLFEEELLDIAAEWHDK